MTLLTFRPTSPSRRHLRLVKFSFTKSFSLPLKSLTYRLKKHAGRNHSGILTVGSQGGGHKKRYRKISSLDFFDKSIVEQIEYDPYRSAFIARCFNLKTLKHFYTLAPQNLKIGNFISSQPDFFEPGSRHLLENIPVGSKIFNLALSKTFRACSSAGTFGRVLKKSNSFALILLPSGEHRLVPSTSSASVGVCSNPLFRYVIKGKAGRSRWLGLRPRVRGVAMNPIDHGHGGGEGKTSGGRVSVTPWGKPAHNVPTSRSSSCLIITPRKRK